MKKLIVGLLLTGLAYAQSNSSVVYGGFIKYPPYLEQTFSKGFPPYFWVTVTNPYDTNKAMAITVSCPSQIRYVVTGLIAPGKIANVVLTFDQKEEGCNIVADSIDTANRVIVKASE